MKQMIFRPSAHEDEILLTARAAARLLGVSLYTFRAIVLEGKIKGRAVPGFKKPKYSRDELLKLITRVHAQEV